MTSPTRLFGLELDRRGIATLVGGAGTLVVAGLFFQLTLPQWGKLQELDTQVAQKNAELTSKQQQLKQLPSLSTQRERSRRLLDSVVALIPTPETLPSLLIDTTRLVQASGADLRKFTPSQLKAIPELSESTIDIRSTSAKVSLNATYAESITMLRNIERLEELLRIENLSLKPIDAKDNPGRTDQRLTAEFELTAYVLDPNAPPPTTTTVPPPTK